MSGQCEARRSFWYQSRTMKREKSFPSFCHRKAMAVVDSMKLYVMYLPETVYNFVLWVKIHLKESKKIKIYTSKQNRVFVYTCCHAKALKRSSLNNVQKKGKKDAIQGLCSYGRGPKYVQTDRTRVRKKEKGKGKLGLVLVLARFWVLGQWMWIRWGPMAFPGDPDFAITKWCSLQFGW